MLERTHPLTLADWRRRVHELYVGVRQAEPGREAGTCVAFREARDALFRHHADSPLDPGRRASFRGLSYYPYEPAWRVVGVVDGSVPRTASTVHLAGDGLLRLTRVAVVRFAGPGGSGRLNLYWIEGYGGGLFLPFADATSGRATYAGGRYLIDTIKGADLGRAHREEGLVLDFNYAYNPSCAYSPRWSCPLPPQENRLPFAVEAGERTG